MSCTELLPPPHDLKTTLLQKHHPHHAAERVPFHLRTAKGADARRRVECACSADLTAPVALPKHAAVFLSTSLSLPRDFLSVLVALVLLGSVEGGVG